MKKVNVEIHGTLTDVGGALANNDPLDLVNFDIYFNSTRVIDRLGNSIEVQLLNGLFRNLGQPSIRQSIKLT